jgi:hypothetical protein
MVTIEQLATCKTDLEEFAELLTKFNPRASKSIQNCLKKLVWGLKNGKRGNIIKRLERHKTTLELAMIGLSRTASWNGLSGTKIDRTGLHCLWSQKVKNYGRELGYIRMRSQTLTRNHVHIALLSFFCVWA